MTRTTPDNRIKQLAWLALALIPALAAPATARAHSLWINAFESHAHQPPHTMVSLGWGHALPMGDILTSPKARIAVDLFELVAPDLTPTPLRLPEFKLSTPKLSTPDFDLFAADAATQKIAFKKDSTPGVYQFSLASRPTAYTKYIDTAGKTRLKLKTRDKIKDIKKVIMSVKFQAFAKAFTTRGEWTEPAPLGHGLEIIPRTDLSRLSVNDLVEVDVLFHGKPLHSSAAGKVYITAQSRGFGQEDGFSLHAYVKNGRARIRVQTPGQWKIMAMHQEKVLDHGPLKHLHGKVDSLVNAASLTFTVR